jgi:hypothetical protein
VRQLLDFTIREVLKVGTKSLVESRETHIEATKQRTRVVNEYVRGSGIKLFQAGPLKVGIRNDSAEREKLFLTGGGRGTRNTYLIVTPK